MQSKYLTMIGLSEEEFNALQEKYEQHVDHSVEIETVSSEPEIGSGGNKTIKITCKAEGCNGETICLLPAGNKRETQHNNAGCDICFESYGGVANIAFTCHQCGVVLEDYEIWE